MKPHELLIEHGLKRTSCREGIIAVVESAGHPLSELEIRQRLSGNYDRTTFYRSFKTLEESGIIHKIVIDNSVVRYALAITITQKSNHAHFFCVACGTVHCMESIPIAAPALPDGFTSDETEMIIKGTCKSCK